ncbi:MAG: DUF721 domain-containing protein [Burkholderiales bacterium]|nr:DUF721 domain-containing protein [Burkholderiales bacterium]
MQLETAAALQRALHGALPPQMAASVGVLHCENGVAVVAAASGAAAARLRMLAPRLTRALRLADPQVREMRIVVDVSRQPRVRTERPCRLDETGMAAWRQLANSLPEGPLRQACRALAGGQERSGLQHQPLENQEGEHDGDHE